MEKYITKNQQETFALGKAFVKKIKSNAVVALDGDLGTGKTVFVKGMAAGLGITEHILSPTFTLHRQYSGLNHFDVYRIDDPTELNEIGFSEYLDDDNITIIEWASLVAELMPRNKISVSIKRTQVQDQREIIIDFGEQNA